jgi:hypothetical protein
MMNIRFDKQGRISGYGLKEERARLSKGQEVRLNWPV